VLSARARVPEEKRVAELYVPGLDLSTGLAVDAGDREVWEWRRKGHSGDGTLVCLECYQGADRRGGPLAVPLVPRGRVGGARQPHFAHPPGMAPPGGHRNRESAWHWEAKHRLARWAITRGAVARVEARTADGRRRSDVSITLPGGRLLAVEVQHSPVTDAEVLARREDYLRGGITVVWVWHGRPPHVLYRFGEPGWVYDLAQDQIGLVCGGPHPARPGDDQDGGRTLGPHWPPCPGDATSIRWMPLADLRLSARGLQASRQVLTHLEEEASEAARQARTQPWPAATPPLRERRKEPRLSPVPARRVRLSASADPAPRRSSATGREDDRSRAIVQAQAAVYLARRIRKIEARIAELDERRTEPAGCAEDPHATATNQPDQTIDPEIGALIAQLKILRMQAKLLPEHPGQQPSTG
jgi:hypothetical protein